MSLYYCKPNVAIFNNLTYIQFSLYIYVISFYFFNLIFIFILYFLKLFNLIRLYLFNLIALYPFNLIRIYSFNSIRQNIHLISGTGSSHGIRKIMAWERIIANTIWRTRKGFDIGRDLPAFLASVLDKTEYIC